MDTRHCMTRLAILVGMAAGLAGPVSSLYAEGLTATQPADSSMQALLKAIDVGYYELPRLTLKKDTNYAKSSVDVEPFRHVTPAKEHFLEQMEYGGAGRGIPEPDHLDTVKIGFIGPIIPTVSVATGGKSHEEGLGMQMLRGVRLAVEQANARGGYLKRKIPFELVIANDNGLWGSSGNVVTGLAYKDRVWAILGSIDGANTHIGIRVALKAELVMLNTADTDPTFIETNIPWVMRCIGDDRQMGYLLVDYLYRKMQYTKVGVIRSSNRYGRFGVREVRDGSRRLGRPIVIEMAFKLGTTDFALQLERLKAAGAQAVVYWGDGADGAQVLNQMRAMGMNQPFYGCDRCISDEFLTIAGKNAEGVLCGSPWNPTRKDPALETFRKVFHERYGVEVETYAAHAYDGMSMIIEAIQLAGLNRAKIRDVLAHRSTPYQGVTGEIPFSAAMDDLGEVFLARVENGRWTYHTRQELAIPQGVISPRDRVSRKTVSAE